LKTSNLGVENVGGVVGGESRPEISVAVFRGGVD